MKSEKIVVGQGTEYPLNGLLTLPDDLTEKVHAAVFVHGSGASNMDEKIFRLTPFRDLAEGLADYVAMDVKSSPAGYGRCAGVPETVLAQVRESVSLLEQSGVAHEFRTTAVKGLHTPEDFSALGRWLAGTEHYFIQSYADSGDILAPGMEAFSREELEELLAAVRPHIPRAQLRGVD